MPTVSLVGSVLPGLEHQYVADLGNVLVNQVSMLILVIFIVALHTSVALLSDIMTKSTYISSLLFLFLLCAWQLAMLLSQVVTLGPQQLQQWEQQLLQMLALK